MRLDSQRILSNRQFFGISVTTPPRLTDEPRGPFLASQPGEPLRTTKHVRDAALFDAGAADAVLRVDPRYCTFVAVQVVDAA